LGDYDLIKPYNLSPEQAAFLSGLVAMSPAERRDTLVKFFPGTNPELVAMVCEFMALAASVPESCREMVELILITDGRMHPHTAEKVNLPTVLGALQGVELAAGVDQDRLCEGCAFRIGTPANQSPSTTEDAHYCLDENPHFMCHMEMDSRGEPTKACVGYAIKMKRLAP
jgi:hypothetical protein